MHVGHEKLDKSLLDVERLDEAREAGLKDVPQLILIKEPHEASVGSLRGNEGQLDSSAWLVSSVTYLGLKVAQ